MAVQPALEEAIAAIRPALQLDGGDIRIIGYNESEGILDVELLGACGNCPMSTMTLKAGVERILKDRVPGLRYVNAVGLEADRYASDEY